MNYEQKLIRDAKTACRAYLRSTYTSDDLALALDLARAGDLRYRCARCFASLPHYSAFDIARDKIPSLAYLYLGLVGGYVNFDDRRQARLIPMLKAEIRRRMRVQFATEPAPVQEVGV